jgi:hypothetical protein
MKFTAYKGTSYEYKTIIPENKKFNGKIYKLIDVFDNFGNFQGHKTAQNLASELRLQNNYSRIDAHSGFTAVYYRIK